MKTSKNFQYFKEKEERLKKSIEKVESKLNWFKENKDSLDDKTLDTWNDWHDLKDRLKDRLSDNFHNYSSWHFSEHGWTIIM